MARGMVIKAGDIFRDIGAMISSLDVRGGGGSPKELRSDTGVWVHYSLTEELSRHVDLITAEVDLVTISTAANTTASSIFSFPEDHYIIGFSIGLTAGIAADAVWWSLTARPQAGVAECQILHGFAADMTDLAAGEQEWGTSGIDAVGTSRHNTPLPVFGRANTDYRLEVRTGTPAVTWRAMVYHISAPLGVKIAH